MLFFIHFHHFQQREIFHLNTSHVILYPTRKNGDLWKSSHLNTSHVILYQIELTDREIREEHLNTSHVILYPKKYCRCYGVTKI